MAASPESCSRAGQSRRTPWCSQPARTRERSVPVSESSFRWNRPPATLTRFAGPKGLVGRVVAGPDLEIRQDAAGRLLVSDYYVEGESPEDRVVSTLALIRRRFHGADTRHAKSMPGSAGGPLPADGMPIVGFTPDAPRPLSRRHARGCGDGLRRGPARHRRDRGRRRGRGIGALPRVPLRIASRPWSRGAPRSCGRPHDSGNRACTHSGISGASTRAAES